MDSRKRYQRAKTIFAEASELKAEKRDDYLEQACKGDQELLKLVHDLLSADKNADSFIEQPVVAVSSEDDPVIGTQIGPYQIKRQLGRGGMGVVYLAIRADDFRKQVAVKLIKRGMDSDEVLKRFQSERQTLAALEHANIARLLDGGTTKDGLQYFVMEYVEGTPIDEFCDRHKLKTLDRLKLFRKVCSAVQFAHQNLIIHRDLKPANILVTEEGEPKLLDFGIAKLLNPDLSFMSVALTKTGMQIMTPEYASPEQIRDLPITTRSDVYTLGVLLYELLTGHRPYRLQNRVKDEIARIICEEEPTRPSTVIGRTEEMDSGDETIKITPETVSTNRDGKPGLLRKRLAGDIDNIVLFALRKEPERRYGSAELFSEDIKRHLEGLPVTARKATTRYRAGKFIGRNRVGVTAAALISLSLIGGIIATTWQARIAAEERDHARIAAQKAEKVSDFLVDIFEAADPNQTQGDTITARRILEAGAKQIETELQNQPEVQAMLMNVIGHIYRKLGRYNIALNYIRQGLDIRKSIFQKENIEIAESYAYLCDILLFLGEPEEAEDTARELVRIRSKLHTNDDPALAQSLVALGAALWAQDKQNDAKPFLEKAIAIYHSLATEDESYAVGLYILGRILRDLSAYAKAEPLLVRAVAIQEKLKGEYDEELATFLTNLAYIFEDQGKYSEAEPLFRRALGISERNLGKEHPVVAFRLNALALFLREKNDLAEAESLMRRAAKLIEMTFGENHATFSRILANLASIVKQSDPYEAESLYRRALTISKKQLDSDDHSIGFQLDGLAGALQAQGKYTESESSYKKAIEIISKSLKEDHPRVGKAIGGLARLFYETGQLSVADSLYQKALKIYDVKFGTEHPKTQRLRQEYQEMTEKLRTTRK